MCGLFASSIIQLQRDNQLEMENQDIREVLMAMEREASVSVQRENMFDEPIRLYLIIKILYQHYKKNHQLQIMQAKIFEIELKQNNNQNFTYTKVSPASLFEYHELSEREISFLIQMKKYLKQSSKENLYTEILKGIEKQTEVGEYMKCYRALLNRQYTANDMRIYKIIEERMINKILSHKEFRAKEIKILSRNLLALPKIEQPILVLISRIYEKVKNAKQFEPLYLIFSHKFPEYPSETDIAALVRISLPQTLQKLLSFCQNYPQLKPTIVKVAEQQAKNKLNTMQLNSTAKTIDILNFIVEVVKLGIPIWHQIIEWQHRAAQQPKNILKMRLQGILVGMLKDFRCFETVISIIEKITDIEQHSEIGLVFVRELLKLQSREYLQHRIVRRFLAIMILKYNSSEEYFSVVFSKKLKFIEIILELFNYKNNSINFYNHILNNQNALEILHGYLTELADKMPVKAKEFFIKCTLADAEKSQLFGQVQTPMLKLMGETITIEIAANFIRDLSLSYPTKGFIYILSKLMTVFKEHKRFDILKNVTVRSLNIILIRTPKHLINKTFQIQFPIFIKEHMLKEKDSIFIEVSQETIEELKKTYEGFMSRKKV